MFASDTTDGLASYRAAMKDLGNANKQEIGRWANNRVENSHLPFRRREQAMPRFRQMKLLKKFASVPVQAMRPYAVIPAAPLEGLARLRRWPVSAIPLSCKLRCGTCGSKSVELKAIADATDGTAIGLTTEREWQALVRRSRD